MSIDTPEQLGARLLVDGRLAVEAGVKTTVQAITVAIRADREQIVAALLAECNEHPGCDGWIRAFAEAIGSGS